MLRMCHRFTNCKNCSLGEYFECEYCELFNDNTFNDVYYCAMCNKYMETIKTPYEIKL